jgi:hypothetical protein
VRFSLSALILVAGLAYSSFAAASGDTLKFDDIRSQQAEIRAGVMAKSGRYRDLPATTREELLSRQTRMLAVIDGKHVPNDLTHIERTEVFNDLEWIEAAINRTDDEKLVCEYTRTIGSNRKQRVCRTAAEAREQRERAREALDRSDPQMRRGG